MSDTAWSEPSAWSRVQSRLRRLFAYPGTEMFVAALVLVSVVLTLLDFASWDRASPHSWGARLAAINDAITYVFIVELTLRFLAAPVKRRFFREYWLDIIAVAPLFRVFRAVRLLRLIRLLRLFGVASRLGTHFPEIVRRGALEYVVVCGLLLLTVVFGTGAMMYFEPAQEGGSGFNLQRSFWFSVYSLFAGEPIPGPPQTIAGRLIAVFVMFMGLTIFAMLTGTVSAFMVERLRTEDRRVEWDQLAGHVVICGWSSKAEIIIHELQAAKHGGEAEIVVIAQLEHEPPPDSLRRKRNVYFLRGDFTRVSVLEQAGILRAKTCIVLSDVAGGRSEQDADARTILAALTVEKLNPSVYTCAELLNPSYGTHLQMGNVNDYVVSGEYGAYLLAQSALSRGLLEVYSELLTYRRGNELYRKEVPESWHGRPFDQMMQELKQKHGAILIAVEPRGGAMIVNPREHLFAPGDEIVAISRGELKLE